MRTLSLWALVFLAVAGSLRASEQAERDKAFLEEIPERYTSVPDVSLHIEKAEDEILTCRLVNRSDKPVFFVAYSIRSPWYRVEMFQPPWTADDAVGFCGNGLYGAELPPGKSVCFPARHRPREAELRAGLDIYRSQDGKPEPIWSKPVKVKKPQGLVEPTTTR